MERKEKKIFKEPEPVAFFFNKLAFLQLWLVICNLALSNEEKALESHIRILLFLQFTNIFMLLSKLAIIKIGSTAVTI